MSMHPGSSRSPSASPCAAPARAGPTSITSTPRPWGARSGQPCPVPTSRTVSPRRPARQRRAQGACSGQPGHRHVLQRHAVGASAVRAVPASSQAAREAGAIAQVAGGVPAMCDGVTQGQTGMELSLFSRESSRPRPSHCRTTCSTPRCAWACATRSCRACSWRAHLRPPARGVRAGRPHALGRCEQEKARIRKLYAEGKVGRASCSSPNRAYHSAGTCTFYGTANSNQMLMEVMGLHLPGSAFIPPNTPLRDALTAAATRRAARITALGDEYIPIGEVVDERASSTQSSVCMQPAARPITRCTSWPWRKPPGSINWDDFSDLSEAVPLLARIYPTAAPT